MKAVVITRYGGPQALEIREVPEPVASTGEELVLAEAAGVNFADTMAAMGGYPGTPKPPLVAGREFCGTRRTDGSRVMGYLQWGAFADIVAGKNHLLWQVPEKWSAAEGAAFPVNFFTAYFAYWKAGLLDLGEKAYGRRVLIQAAGGGVGTAAVQIGKILGVEMYGTSSSDEKLERVKRLGLQHGINYKQQDYVDAIKELTHGEGVDAVFEMLGGEHATKSIYCLRDFGRVIAYGSATGQRAQIDVGSLYTKGASVHGLWLTYLADKSALMQKAWQELSQWISTDQIRPVIGAELPMQRVGDAYELLQERKNFGKIVIKIR